jgi:hypothetical protein
MEKTMNQRPNPSNAAKASADNLSTAQKEMGDTFAEANQHWLTRAKAEGDSMSELMTKLSAARSMPDVAAVYQEWMTQRMQRLAEDGQKLAADSQKFMTAWTKLFSNGSAGRMT